jgi:predicted acetyltransferase
VATGGTETAAGGAVTAAGGAERAAGYAGRASGGAQRAAGRAGRAGRGTVLGLRLRPPRAADEAAFAAAHRAMAREGFVFGLGYQPGQPWDRYLSQLEDHRHGRNLPARHVPGTFLVADIAGEIVGRTSVRFTLNAFLAEWGGHIGYCVLPQHRRRGYATEILRQSLIIARAAGVGRVLVTCDQDNAGSRAVIEACGGVLDSVVHAGGRPPAPRFWID